MSNRMEGSHCANAVGLWVPRGNLKVIGPDNANGTAFAVTGLVPAQTTGAQAGRLPASYIAPGPAGTVFVMEMLRDCSWCAIRGIIGDAATEDAILTIVGLTPIKRADNGLAYQEEIMWQGLMAGGADTLSADEKTAYGIGAGAHVWVSTMADGITAAPADGESSLFITRVIGNRMTALINCLGYCGIGFHTDLGATGTPTNATLLVRQF